MILEVAWEWPGSGLGVELTSPSIICAAQYNLHAFLFRAPELFEVPSNCTVSAKTDIWSLGCSMYAAAFGQSPCDGSALAAVSGKIPFPKKQ